MSTDYILEDRETFQAAKEKNRQLVENLLFARKNFCDGIGTNAAKRRLNRIAETELTAYLIRLAIEIEDHNILAKRYYGTRFQVIHYRKKFELIAGLCDLCRDCKIVYGERDNVIYFELPGCEQISWHIMEPIRGVPPYRAAWDQKRNSTLFKLEDACRTILREHGKS